MIGLEEINFFLLFKDISQYNNKKLYISTIWGLYVDFFSIISSEDFTNNNTRPSICKKSIHFVHQHNITWEKKTFLKKKSHNLSNMALEFTI